MLHVNHRRRVRLIMLFTLLVFLVGAAVQDASAATSLSCAKRDRLSLRAMERADIVGEAAFEAEKERFGGGKGLFLRAYRILATSTRPCNPYLATARKHTLLAYGRWWNASAFQEEGDLDSANYYWDEGRFHASVATKALQRGTTR
jgi:hypothetical protein